MIISILYFNPFLTLSVYLKTVKKDGFNVVSRLKNSPSLVRAFDCCSISVQYTCPYMRYILNFLYL